MGRSLKGVMNVDPEVVYIERDALSAMFLSVVEVYNRECMGYVFGRMHQGRLIIDYVQNLAAVVRRTNAKIHLSERAWRRTNPIILGIRSLYPWLGDFHSHPASGPYKRPFKLSREDALSMVERGHRVSIIINASRRGSKLLEWCIRSNGTRLRGTLLDWDLHVTAYRVVRDSERNALYDDDGVPKTVPMRLQVAPSTIKALNRTQYRRNKC